VKLAGQKAVTNVVEDTFGTRTLRFAPTVTKIPLAQFA